MTATLTALHTLRTATLDELAHALGTDHREIAAGLYDLARRGLVQAARDGDRIRYTPRGTH